MSNSYRDLAANISSQPTDNSQSTDISGPVVWDAVQGRSFALFLEKIGDLFKRQRIS
ncbi:MAG: hypothetical protein P8N76_22735 [Pirellulaceae bacterium]|nr:hypothetical protein [Pirellulaceae bacterium]